MKTLSFLIVEDEPIALARVKNQLLTFGYDQLFTAGNVQTAKELLLEPKNSFDLVILDINLNGQKHSGIDLAKHINQHFDIPIIFLSGLVDENTLQNAQLTSHVVYITKPFNPVQLYTSIRVALMGHASYRTTDGGQMLYKNGDIWVSHKRRYIKVTLDKVVYIESQDKLCYIHQSGNIDAIPSYASLKSFMLQANYGSIIQAHRKFLVNLNFVCRLNLESNEIGLDYIGQIKWLPVAKKFRKSLYSNFQKLKTKP